ncbi:DUF3304 domain-containing protein [Niveibacterium sp. COAC-50]|uniref:DUF3304 domain-containing protein n=1 Tax=Niveibacterium sp. COAC-50 TaxID=2729384 RepID=UPI00155586FC|nr:DUF3304 domain-containing protein [Niveibacterium sp. COAC-50]
MIRTLAPFLAAAWLAAFLNGCGNKAANDAAKPEGSVSSISGYNYTIEGIQEFSVNGAWGGGISIGGGGGNVCCVELPEKWSQGLSAKVTWERSDCGGSGPGNERCPFGKHPWPRKALEATVAIEPYDRPNTVQVMFLPNDEVKIYVFDAGPIHPEHPSKLGQPRPLDHPEWKPAP